MIKVRCGKIDLQWMTPATILSDVELQHGVHPSEWTQAQAWLSPLRRAEYLRSRWLLRHLTGFRAELGKTPAGAPIWPPGYVGSLTHKNGFIGLALESATQWLSLGVDAEEPALMQLAFIPRLCLPEEDALLRGLAAGDDDRHRFLLTVLFSFKESLFKALFPLGETMFYFHDAQITALDQKTEQITVCLRRAVSAKTPRGFVLTGSYRSFVSDGRSFVLTCVGMGRAISGGTGNDSCG